MEEQTIQSLEDCSEVETGKSLALPDVSTFAVKTGHYRTMSLFQEFKHEDTDKFPFYYNLTERDKPTSFSLKKLYIKEADPVEYTFAMKYIGSYQIWKGMTETAWFGPYAKQWRSELQAKLHSEAFQKIASKASSGDLVAMKYIADHATSDRAKRGRPQKNPVRQIPPIDLDIETEFFRLNDEDRKQLTNV